MTAALLFTLVLLQPPAAQQGPPLPQATEADYVIKDFKFNSGETLPELRIHYRTLGTPRKNAQGIVTNAVLVMHGTGGTGGQFTGRASAASYSCPASRSTSRSSTS
jgi:homoserine O-acetyltransferase